MATAAELNLSDIADLITKCYHTTITYYFAHTPTPPLPTSVEMSQNKLWPCRDMTAALLTELAL